MSPGPTPTYDWSLSEAPVLVQVVDTADPERRVWGVRAASGILLPVEHGADEAESLASGSLSQGTTYRLVMSRATGATFYLDFTP